MVNSAKGPAKEISAIKRADLQTEVASILKTQVRFKKPVLSW
jgi:hypothetical protein